MLSTLSTEAYNMPHQLSHGPELKTLVSQGSWSGPNAVSEKPVRRKLQ
jgi:hypothetical protein